MIHVCEQDGEFEVWTGCEEACEKDGRIVGLGRTRRVALEDAVADLEREIEQVRKLLKQEISRTRVNRKS